MTDLVFNSKIGRGLKRVTLVSLMSLIYQVGYSQCSADFTSSAPGCVGSNVDFYAADTLAGTTFSWLFGSGATPTASTSKNPTGIIYSTTGAKNVLLIVSNGGCGDTLTKIVTINDTPTVAFTHVTLICAGSSVDFINTSSTGTGITYSWDFGSGSSPNTSTSYSPQDIMYSTPGTKTITLTVDNGNCSSSSISSITVEVTPWANFTSTSPSCQGDTVLFANNSTSALTYQWELDLNGSSASPASSTNADPGGVVYNTSGLKTVRLIAINGNCQDTSLQSIQINETPMSSFTSTAPNCGNVGIDFTNTGSSGTNWTYSWDFGQGAQPTSSTGENPSGVMYSNSGSKTVTFTVSDANCSAVTTQSISIQSTPTATFTSTAPSCEQDSVSFTNTGSTGGSWTYSWDFGTASSPSTSTQENPIGITYSSYGTKSIKFLISDGTCSDSAISTITIKEKPGASFTSSAPGCGNVATNFTNTGSTGGNWTYSWDFGTTSTPSTSSAEHPSGITYGDSGVKVVTLTITDGQCATTTAQNITILPTPTAAFVSTGPGCEGDSVSFTNTGSTGGSWTYSWDFGTSASPATSTMENPTGIIYGLYGTKAITLAVTDGNCSDSITQNLTIYDRPDVNFITSTVPVCAFDGVNFTNAGSSASKWSYNWDFGEGATPSVAVSENVPGVYYATGGNKIITFTIADAYCTESYTDSISINDLPIANAGLDTTICANRSVQLGAPAVTNYLYSWFPSESLDQPTSSQPIASPKASFTTYILRVEDTSTACVNFDSVFVTMLDPLKVNAGIDVEICLGDSVQIGSALVEGQSYQWIPVNGINNDTMPNPLVSPDSTTVYTVVVDAAGCDSVTDQVSVTVHPLPDADAGEDQVIALGSSIQLQATGGVMYDWDPKASLNNGSISNPLASPKENTTYTVTITNVFNCVQSDTVVITVREPELWAATGFTPNNDGLNDVFYIRGLTSGIRDFSFRIYDEWGSMLFYTNTILEGWDGTKRENGSKLPSGSYVYKVDGINSKGEIVNLTGMVNLIR